ncbi:hypothetical protein [Thiomonas sp. FB-6]|uniref:hypothetical protein n=1 Tax=Thiomonas sp. FB-6 TaxID=1158291 RepID=UPI000371EF57|nr:hypothetical protein [Thiomonas sp. FB-6]
MRAPTSAIGEPDHQLPPLTGPFPVNQEHGLPSPLQLARDEFEAAGSRFATDAIRDARLRQLYKSNIQRISREVQAEVDAGRVSVVEGARFCQRMRNQVMEETRVASSAQGRAYAQKVKPTGTALESLLDKYASELFKRPFSSLSESQKSQVFYSIVASSGRDNLEFSTETRRLRILGKVGLIVTAIVALHAVVIADDKPREIIRQGAVIGGGMVGGGVAGALLVTPICGPGAVVCAVAIVLLGSTLGGLAAELVERTAEEELEEFARWNLR